MSVIKDVREEVRLDSEGAAPAPAVDREWRIDVSPYFRFKAILGPVLGASLLVPALPIIGLLALVMRLTSPGPAIYRQTRVGKNLREFVLYKLRTMRNDAEADSGPVWAQANDSRVTRVGRMLRKWHLDELPQLLNVVKGEMSLVGPRPERPEIARVLSEEIPGYHDRHVVRPGITGLAQINFQPDSNLDDVRRKLIADADYIMHASFSVDVRILACTLLRLLGLRGTHTKRMLGLNRKAAGK